MTDARRIWTRDQMEWIEAPDNAKPDDVIEWGRRNFRLVMTDGVLRAAVMKQEANVKIGPKEEQLREMKKARTSKPGLKNLRAMVDAVAPKTPKATAEANLPAGDAETGSFSQETTMAKKSKKTAKPSKAKRAKTPKAPKAAKAKAPRKEKAAGGVVRPGSKVEIVAGLLQRASGCTTREVLDATGWPSVSMPGQAKAAGLKLRKEKEKGEPTRYFGEAA